MTALRTAPALTAYVDPKRMAQWLRVAPAGQRMVYATGPSLEGGRHPSAVLAREWQKDRKATLHHKTRADGLTDYIAVKSYPERAVIHRSGSGGALRQAQGERPRGASPAKSGADPMDNPAFAASDEGRMYQHLRALAARGFACPSHAGLAARLGLEGRRGSRSADAPRQQARYLFDKLVASGLIRLVEPARFGARVIEITETGDRTASQPDGVK